MIKCLRQVFIGLAAYLVAFAGCCQGGNEPSLSTSADEIGERLAKSCKVDSGPGSVNKRLYLVMTDIELVLDIDHLTQLTRLFNQTPPSFVSKESTF